jgi:cytochrome c2
MNTQLKIVLFTLLVTGFYTYVGAIVPQMEAHPPKSTEIRKGLGGQELAAAGKEIFFGKGTCALCHTIGGKGERCPDLAGVGSRAATRLADFSAEEYLAQSLYQPNAYVVDGFTPTMPQIDRPPIGLEPEEIAAVVAFLQSQGGNITVTADTRFEIAGAPPPPPPTPPTAGEGGGPLQADAIIEKYGCGACHDFETAARRIGPSLYDIGARQPRAEILHSLLEPDATIAEANPPYPAGLMSATLVSTGFFSGLSLTELDTLVDHLAGLQGDPP